MQNPNIKSLFKYKPINQFTLDIIANHRIYYPLPESFNDPFDTRCSFKEKKGMIHITDPQKIDAAFAGQNTSGMGVFKRKDFTNEITQFQNRLKSFGILSLAETAKDILMWSHYADDHKGICIELERSPDNELGNSESTRKVAYAQSYPSLTPKSLGSAHEIDAALKRVLYTKSKQWTYEDEWRNFKDTGGKVYSLPGEIKSLTFGCRVSDMDIDIIKKLVIGSNIALYQASLKENEFGIKLSRIT